MKYTRGQLQKVVQYCTKLQKHDGTYGKLAYRTADFRYVKGYDESGGPAGGHDHDLMLRLRILGRGKECVSATALSYAVLNTKRDTIQNVDPQYKNDSWSCMERRNAALF